MSTERAAKPDLFQPRPLSEEDLTSVDAQPARREGGQLPFFLLAAGMFLTLLSFPLKPLELPFPTRHLVSLAGVLSMGVSVALIVLRVCPVARIVRIVIFGIGLVVLNPVFRLVGSIPGWTDLPWIGVNRPNNWLVPDICLLAGFGALLWGFYRSLLELRAVWNRAEFEREELAREVLERKEALRALGESERMYREAIQVAGAVPYTQLYEPDEYPFIGQGIAEMVGVEPGDFNRLWESQILKETILRGEVAGMTFGQAVRACREEGKTWKADFRIVRPDGEERWLTNSAVQVRNNRGKVIGCLGIMQDVTDRKKTEEAIRDRERRQSAFSYQVTCLMGMGIELSRAENLDDLCRLAVLFGTKRLGFREPAIWFLDESQKALNGVCKVDSEGRIVDIRTTVLPLPQESGEEQLFPGVEAIVPSGFIPEGGAYSAPLWDGERLMGLLSANGGPGESSLPEHEGELFALFAESLAHLIARKCVEDALRENQRVLATLLGNLPGMVYRCANDKNWTMEFMSQGTRDITGRPVEDYLSGRVNFGEHVLHGEDRERVWAEVQTALDAKKSYELTYRIVRPDGEIRWVWERGTGVHDASGELVALEGFITDVTEKLEAEQERERLEGQFRQTQKLESLGILAGGIAHDFNNLLVGILGHAGLASADFPIESPARESLRCIETAAQRAAELTQQMLAYSGRGKFIVEPVDLSALVYEMGQLLEVSISKKAQLCYRLGADLPHVEADATQIRQVVMNLITNASDALEDREGTIVIRTGLKRLSQEEQGGLYLMKPQTEGEYVYVEVSDSGCGMDSETSSRIFDPFFTTKFAGRGLGLAAVLGIVRGHHGTLEVDSAPGMGTTFRAYFPRVDHRAVRPIELVPDPPAWKGRGSILVVDDEEIVRKLASAALERAGFQVVTARDGREAVERFQADPDEFAAVLLDMTMPLMSGEETFRMLRGVRPDVRVILSSGYSESQASESFTEALPAAFLQKPYRPADLIAKVHHALESPSRARSEQAASG